MVRSSNKRRQTVLCSAIRTIPLAVSGATTNSSPHRRTCAEAQHGGVLGRDPLRPGARPVPAASSLRYPVAPKPRRAASRSWRLPRPSTAPGWPCIRDHLQPRLRRDFRSAMNGIVPHVNTLGLVACEAALAPWCAVARRLDRLPARQSRSRRARGRRHAGRERRPGRGHVSCLDRYRRQRSIELALSFLRAGRRRIVRREGTSQ